MPGVRHGRAVIAVVTAIAALLICGANVVAAQPTVREEPLTFTSGDLRLEGTVLLPDAGHDTAVPGLVLVHGAGRGERATVRAEAEAFTRAGIATFIYDKRTDGYSLTDRDFALLAQDALAAARVLAAHPGVRDDAVGLWGLSEGAWVVPLAATTTRADEVIGFVVLAAATGVTPASQHAWFLEGELRRRGVSGAVVDAVAERGMHLLIGLDAFPEAFHDPVPPLRRITTPMLAVWGADDVIEPAGASVDIVMGVVSGANPGATLVVIDNATHDLTRTADPTLLVDGYPELVADWVRDIADGRIAETRLVGSTPPLDHDPPTLRPPDWWTGGAAQLTVWLTLTGAFGWLALRAVRWTDRRQRRLAMRLTGGLGVACMLGLPSYIMTVLISEVSVLGPVVWARPVVWTALQVLAVVVLLGAVAVAVAVGGDTAPRRAVVILAVAAVFAGWAWWWRLVPFP